LDVVESLGVLVFVEIKLVEDLHNCVVARFILLGEY
jgi:hypothetical protein